MAGSYGGHFLKGMAGGIQSGFEMGWKKKEQKKLDDAKKKLEEESLIINSMMAELGEDGHWSDDDLMKINTAILSGSYELQEHYKSAREAISTMNKNKSEQELKWFENITGALSDGTVDPKNASEIFEFGRQNFATSEKSKNLYTAYEKMYTAKYEAAQTPKAPQEVTPYDFYSGSPASIQGQIGQSVAGQTKGLEGIKFNQPTPEQPTELDQTADTYKKLDYAYATGNANYFNQMAKSLGVQTTFDTYKQKYEKPKGVEAGTGTAKPRATNLELLQEYRDKALYASTWEEAEQIINDYAAAGYDASQLGVTKEAWANNQPEPEPEPEAKGPGTLQKIGDWINKVTTRNDQKQPQKDYTTMSEKELYDLALSGDALAYEEAKRRGLI